MSLVPVVVEQTLSLIHIWVEAIIKSMTMKERKDPSVINASRKKRIAAGSGNSVAEVNTLLKQFEQMQQMMKRFSGSKFGKGGKMKKAKKKHR